MSGSLVYVVTQCPSAKEATAIARFKITATLFKIEKRVPQVTTIENHLAETALDGQSDVIGNVVCVQETPPNTREQSPIAVFRCCMLMALVQNHQSTARLSKPILTKPHQTFNLPLWDTSFVFNNQHSTYRKVLQYRFLVVWERS